MLRKQLDGKVGEVVVQPLSAAEIQNMLRYCYAQDLPVTARGAGTGNYGQAVPLARRRGAGPQAHGRNRGNSAGWRGRLPAGRAPGRARKRSAQAGWELRCYPSTIVKASVGGFLGGGSGGIGSVAHGDLRDFQTVRAIEVVTMEAEPRVVFHEGEAVHEILHAWGTNGIITRIWLALAPAVEWSQCVVAFDTFDAAFDFSEKIATDAELDQAPGDRLRMADPFFLHSGAAICAGRQIADLFHDRFAISWRALEAAAQQAGGEVTYSGAYPVCARGRCFPITPGTTPRCGP